jgi:carboxypeptidase Taq
MSERIRNLREYLGKIQDIQAAASVLEWDLETYMPEGASEARSQQIATLRQLAHDMLTSDETVQLLEAASSEIGDADALDDASSLVRVTREDAEKARRVPGLLVAEIARTSARSRQTWKEAREANQFDRFAPDLERLVDLSRQLAEAIGHDGQPYDALLDQYEPGMTTAAVRSTFESLRDELVPIVAAIRAAPQPDASILGHHFAKDRQWDFGMYLLREIGYDFSRGRQDLSAHPFSTSFSVNDVRITTRVAERHLPSALFGTLHEAGHALYEQGIDPSLDRSPLASGTSLGIHESQSRLWENLIGRSLPFWNRYFGSLQDRFPDVLGPVDVNQFYRAINRVEPSLIRVEADEVTYNLHIMLRFELELGMIDGSIPIRELPDAWNDRMQSYLGIAPPSDSDGVLQDIHWSLGAFGYFPTYALGNLMATQIYDAMKRDLGDVDALIEDGAFSDILGWLRDTVHRHGRKLKAPALLKRVTGEDLSASSWLTYVRTKFGALYDL